MTTESDLYEMTTRNRLRIADLLASLDDGQWRSDTLCAGWTVEQLAGHLLQPMLVGFGRFLLTSLRHRGDTDRTVDDLARRLARRDRSELVALLRSHAGDRVDPPRVGPYGPFAETCIHLRDIARPLRLDADVPLQHWVALLDYLTSPGAAPALVPPGRLDGLRLVPDDADAGWGSGAPVRGPLEALAMAVTGRPVLDDLRGDGLPRLAERVGGSPRDAGP